MTQSGQNAVASVLSAVTQPGDTVAVESLTYPGVRSAASLLSLRLAPVAMDEQGLLPEAVAALCRGGSVKALYTRFRACTIRPPTRASARAAPRARGDRAHAMAWRWSRTSDLRVPC